MSELVPGRKRVERQRAVHLLKGSSEDRLLAGHCTEWMPKRYRSIYLAVAVCRCHLR